jgi:hypothetical protein
MGQCLANPLALTGLLGAVLPTLWRGSCLAVALLPLSWVADMHIHLSQSLKATSLPISNTFATSRTGVARNDACANHMLCGHGSTPQVYQLQGVILYRPCEDAH